VELRSGINPAQIIASRSALILRDGSIVNTDGVSPVYFHNVIEGNYYVAVRHRNHLGIMSASAIALNKATSTGIDFTSASTATFGTNAQRNINGVNFLWAGDINSDGKTMFNGSPGGGILNDKLEILRKLGLLTPNNSLVSVYDKADLNFDGTVKYNGASNDKNVILNNVGLLTPNNSIIEQLAK
jgi:hypothetical protein